MKVIIAGGGTGGHVFPAISIAEEILARNGSNEVLFVGTKNGMEKDAVPERGYGIEFISSGGIVGKSPFAKLGAAVSVLAGVAGSARIIRDFGPDAVVGVGGYASVPTVLCGFLARLPTAVCEQNSVPGLANRVLSKFAAKILITFEESRGHFPERKTVLTGNPIRRELAMAAAEKRPATGPAPGVLVLGGSQGARRLNEVVPGALAGTGRELRVLHQTGEADRDAVERAYGELGMEAEVFAFAGDMGRVYGKTDVVICRAGAGTIAEAAAFSMPSILVPLASSTHGHQLANARVAERNGAAVVIEEKDLDAAGLAGALEKTLEPATLAEMAAGAGRLGRPEAAERIVDEIEKLAGCDRCTER